ncbi:MAG: hypothetical protein ACRDLK_12060 [Gaiellaceae bacterium]
MASRLLLLALVLALVPSAATAAPSRRVHAGPLSVAVPGGWQWRVERGHYRDCSNPIVRLWLSSYPVPAWWGEHEGWLVVPRGQVLIAVTEGPTPAASTPWRGWTIDESGLKRAATVGGNRYAAEVRLPGNRAVTGIAWLGSLPLPKGMLATTDRVLRSLHAARRYGCR